MKTHNQTHRLRQRAFSLVELFIIILILAILAGLLLPALAKSKVKAQRIQCVNYLKQIGLAFRIFATDNGDKFPMQVPAHKSGSLEYVAGGNAYRHFQALSNELSNPIILVCPSDNRTPASRFPDLRNQNLSYFVGLDANEILPQALLSGDRNLAINGTPVNTGIVDISPDTALSWTESLHNRQGNVALGDGSVQQLSDARLREQIRNADMQTNRFAIP